MRCAMPEGEQVYKEKEEEKEAGYDGKDDDYTALERVMPDLKSDTYQKKKIKLRAHEKLKVGSGE